MNLKDLFVSYNQVEPVVFESKKPIVNNPIYINLPKVQKATSNESTVKEEVVESPIIYTPISESDDYKTKLRNWIIGFEGFRSTPYKDGKYYSIGYGFNGPQYNENSTMTREEANSELDRQLTERETRYQKRFGQKWDNLTDNQKIALISYGYNVGDGRIINGTIAKYLDTGDLDKVRDAINIDKARDENGKLITLPGLTNRRQQERELFDTK